MDTDVFSYITTEETNYATGIGVPIVDGYDFSMHKHIRRSVLYKNSKFTEGPDNGDRPFKNIIRPILNVAYRSEGFDVKDIELFVNNSKNYYKSFLARKFHDKWARMNDMDTFIDDVVESYIDFGGVLVKNVNNIRPEVVPLQRLAFCDQTDLLNGNKCEKHMYTIDQLLDMKGKWDSEAIDQVIVLSNMYKSNTQVQGKKAKTPGKYIEVYELHGMLPEKWLADKYPEYADSNKYCKQMHIIVYTQTESGGNKVGTCLYKGKERKEIYKVLLRDKIFGRALGFGGIEELFEPQVWTNYSEIQIKGMLEQAAKTLYQTPDTAYTTRNNTKKMQNGEVLVHEVNMPLTQVNTYPTNFSVFEKKLAEWEVHARTTGSANDTQLGIDPVSGTPLGTTQIITAQGQGVHEYRRGKIATFIGEIYRDWILNYIVDEMNQGHEWVAELSLDEMQKIAEQVSINQTNRRIVEIILEGGVITPEQADILKETIKADFSKDGNKKFIEILKDDFKDLPLDVYVNIANKQKDLNKMAKGLTNIFSNIFANPQGFVQTMQIPGAAKVFNELLESSGFSSINFGDFNMPPMMPGAVPSPIQADQLAIKK